MPVLLGNMKRPKPVTSCTNCAGPGFIIELTNANCGRMVSGKRCDGTNQRAIGESWKECLTCEAFGYVGAAQCSVCDGFGWVCVGAIPPFEPSSGIISGGALTVAQFTVTLRYQSGEEIKKGDRVLFHCGPAEIELVACAPDDPATTWYVEQFGGGVLIREPNDPNLTFVSVDRLPAHEDLEFVSRAESQ